MDWSEVSEKATRSTSTITHGQTTSVPRPAIIGLVVFGSGAVGMSVELAASRLLAPYFGNSLFVWTSIIGVMLGFMSLGYFLGGRYADRHLDSRNLFWILIGAAVFVALLAFSEGALLPTLAKGTSLRLFAVLSSVVLFSVPSTLLGMVSPYCIRLRMHAVADSGATVGSLYALSTLGSIAGTFATGFWLLSVFGTHDLVTLLGAALAMLSLLVIGPGPDWRRLGALGVLALLVVFSFSGIAHGVDTIDTQYDRYQLREGIDPATGQPLVGLSRDQASAESAAYRMTGEPYRFEYYRFYDLAAILGGSIRRELVIGGGTFSYPRLFISANPTSTVDVVEIDSALYGIAKRDFGYVDDPRINLFFEDGRTFLNRASGPYDAVCVDAFKSAATVPYQLTTRESWQRISDILDDDGVVVMNVIASPSDDRAEFFASLYATIASVFPRVQAFHVQDDAATGLKNTSIIAAKDPRRDIMGTLQAEAPDFAERAIVDYAPPAGTRLLTDDFAPVDQYLLGF